jgi:nucleoporin SEH1
VKRECCRVDVVRRDDLLVRKRGVACCSVVSRLTSNPKSIGDKMDRDSNMQFERETPHAQDPIQLGLDAVNLQLIHPGFLHNLTPSRLPSQAASESSLSPGIEAPLPSEARDSHHRHSHLNLAVSFNDEPDIVDLVSPLLTEPFADGQIQTVDPLVVEHLESHFVGAHHAYAKMASERNFQTFSHGHQDLVLAVDFNYFGTRMVTASSDHRLKVWDKKDDAWTLIESWRAHDAEIVDVSTNVLSSNLLPWLYILRLPRSFISCDDSNMC